MQSNKYYLCILLYTLNHIVELLRLFIFLILLLLLINTIRRFTLLGHGLDGSASLNTTDDAPLPKWLVSPASAQNGSNNSSSAFAGPAAGTFEMYGRIEPAHGSSHEDERDCSIEITLHGFPLLEGFEEV